MKPIAAAAAIVAVLTLAGCPKGTTPGALCSAGESNSCTCTDGSLGAQSCDTSGNFYGACSCSPVCTAGVACAAMPDLKGKDIETAGNMLAAAGLQLPDPVDGTAFVVVQQQTFPAVQVLDQSPAAGTPLVSGTRVPMLKVTYPPDQESLGLPNANFLVDTLTQDDDTSAQAYYDTLDPQPFPNRSTLADWKVTNGVGTPADDETSAIYVSHTDLGFGRHMHMRRKGRRVAFWVDNYPTVEDAIAGSGFFATVAMEWSPADGDPNGPYFTKFFTFDKKGNRITDPKLDEHGAKLQPGVCLVCHGGTLTDLTYASGANLGAKFMPFDLDGLSFSDRPGYTRDDQQDAIKRLNLAVLVTANEDPDYPAGTSPVAQQIQGWYAPALTATTQDNTWLPDGWGEDVDDDAPDLYNGVVKRSCRTCHNQREPYRNFFTYAQFWSKQSLIHSKVFDEGSMPLSERGSRNFWLSSPWQPGILARWLGMTTVQGPGTPVARVALTTQGQIRPGQLVVLDGSDSQYADTWVWSQIGSPAVQLQTGGARATFVAPQAGQVQIQLVVSLAGVPSTPVVLSVAILDAPTAPTSVTAVAGVGQATVSWLPPTSTGNSTISAYKVIASPGGATASTDGSGSQATITGLTRSTRYTFTVTAQNAVGLIGPAATTAAVTIPDLPGKPLTVVATRGNASATVGWQVPASDGGTQVTSYTATASPGGAHATVSCTAPAACATTTTVSGLANGTAYTFTVVATNGVGDGPASDASAAVTPAATAGKPSITTTSRGDAMVTVNWTAPASDGGAPITSYVVTAAPVGNTATLTCTCSTLTATVTGLANGTPYTFTVAAVNAIGTGTSSDPSPSVTPATTPGTPGTPVATAGDSKLNLSWSAPASNGGDGITSYTLKAYLASGGASVASAIVSCSLATCTGSVGSVATVTNGQQYVGTATATNTVGSGAESAKSNSVVPSSNPALPSAPQSVSAVVNSSQSATISWAAPLASGSNGPVTGYVITASPSIPTTTAGAGATSITLNVAGGYNLLGGQSYTFSVAASNSSPVTLTQGPSASAAPVAMIGPPQSPTGATASSPGNASATVSWTFPTLTGGAGHPITSYTITPIPSSGPALTPLVCNSASCLNTGTTSISGLSNGIATSFTVTATNDLGSSAASTASSQVTPFTVPSAPGLSASAASGGASLTWSVPSGNGSTITSYQFFLNGSGTAYDSCNTPSACTTAHSLTGLNKGTSYAITMKAVNGAGAGAVSNTVNVTPFGVPDPVTGLGTTAGAAQVSLSWTAPVNTGGLTLGNYSIAYSSGTTGISGTKTTAGTSINITGLTTCNYPNNHCGASYSFTVTATNSQGSSSGTGTTAVPKVSYVNDNIDAIFTKSYTSGSCTSCHSGASHSPDLTDVVPTGSGTPVGYGGSSGEGSLIYQCPAHDSACSGIMTGLTFFTSSSVEYAALAKWWTDGNLQ